MKFSCSIIIDRPREVVSDLFSNPENLQHYQKGFLRKEPVSGPPGEVGAVSKLYYKMGKGEMILTETVLENDPPNSFEGDYHHKHMDNTMKSTFTDLGNNQTQYDTEIHYTAFRGFLPKVMKTLFPDMFKKQVQKWLVDFKNFVEGECDPIDR